MRIASLTVPDGFLEIVPTPTPMTLVEGDGVVALAETDRPVLTADLVAVPA